MMRWRVARGVLSALGFTALGPGLGAGLGGVLGRGALSFFETEFAGVHDHVDVLFVAGNFWCREVAAL